MKYAIQRANDVRSFGHDGKPSVLGSRGIPFVYHTWKEANELRDKRSERDPHHNYAVIRVTDKGEPILHDIAPNPRRTNNFISYQAAPLSLPAVDRILREQWREAE